MRHAARPFSAMAGLAGTVAGTMLLAACSGDGSPKNASNGNFSPKPIESVERLDAPYQRSVALSSKLNTYRAQTFSKVPAAQKPLGVEHKNVLFTAAYRHSAYINGINCGNYRSSGSQGVETATLTGASTYDFMRSEPLVPAATSTQIFPALFTNTNLRSRIQAVVGGPDLLDGGGPTTANEFYIFNGTILDNAGSPGEYRGFNLDTRYNSDVSKYPFDPIDHIWYSRRGRTILARANLQYFAFATPEDGSIYYPWPVLDNRFLGTLTTVSKSANVALLGMWPENGNQNVTPYGLDTDIAKVVDPGTRQLTDVVRHQYSGTPIHITLPVNEPFLLNGVDFAGGVLVYFRKLPVNPETGVDQPVPRNDVRPFYTIFFTGYNGGVANYTFPTGTKTAYDYEGLGYKQAINPTDALRNGELQIVPTEPLEPNSWYEVGVRLRTASYVLPDTDADSDSDFFTWRFRTNSNTPF